MRRFLPVLAFVVAAAIAGAAIYELAERADDDIVAGPTAVPSPILSPTEEPSPTDGAETPSPTETEAPSEASPEPAEPTTTPEGPRTPTPEPSVTVGPVDTSNGSTPHTGGDSWPAGGAIALLALVIRGRVLRRRSY